MEIKWNTPAYKNITTHSINKTAAGKIVSKKILQVIIPPQSDATLNRMDHVPVWARSVYYIQKYMIFRILTVIL